MLTAVAATVSVATYAWTKLYTEDTSVVLVLGLCF